MTLRGLPEQKDAPDVNEVVKIGALGGFGSVLDMEEIPSELAGAWLFGHPEVRCDNEGWGQWERKAIQAKFKDSHDINRHFRFGNWAIHLNGGPQASEESWAAVSVPINNIKVKDIKSIAYDWYAQYNGSAHILDVGPNLVFSAYDPNNHAARVDFNTYGVDNNIYMADGLANRPVEAGWYKYKMTSEDATERVYWYGNNTGTHSTVPTEGGDYFWSQYITDSSFAEWVIYRIQISFGYWGSTRSTGDVWVNNMRVNGIPVKWEPTPEEQKAIELRDANYIGRPSLMSRNNGIANWDRGSTSPLDQKSTTGWLARLNGGVQSGWDDYARLEIPVDDMPLVDLKTAKWSYYMDTAQSFGINMVIFVHDPFQPDNRAEITQQADIATLAKGTGWNSHVLNPSTDQFYYYGENTTNSNLTEGAPNYYGLDDFIADELFNTWRIYKITFDNGWQTADEAFGNAWVADVELNGVLIPLGPANGKHRKTVLTTKTLEAEGAYTAGDVVSESDTNGVGTDWDFDFGGTGYITKAVVSHPTTALVAVLDIDLYSKPPTCELDDHAAGNGPITADIPFYLGTIHCPALSSKGTGHATVTVTPSTYGGLPIEFGTPKIYAVVSTLSALDFLDDTLLSIALTADMEDL